MQDKNQCFEHTALMGNWE